MADQELVELLMQGAGQWNAWREQHKESMIDLSEAYLSGANLRDADLYAANLRGANLHQANLHQADLTQADLTQADLSQADLSWAHLSWAHLSEANLREANLHGANLRDAHLSQADLTQADLREADLTQADLSQADLSGARIYTTVFAALDLRTVKGLVEVAHDGPSYVELYTLRLPTDGSALHFLRGAGVPDEWIDFWRSTSMHPIQYHSLFISYSSQDDLLARRLHADLQAEGVRCWFAPEDMKIGAKLRPTIDQAIHVHEKLLLLLSEHALASDWVEDEVETGLEKEQRQHREVLFPIRLDESVMQTTEGWAAKLRRTRHIGDFTRWKDHDAYQQAFVRLLRDLKAESR